MTGAGKTWEYRQTGHVPPGSSHWHPSVSTGPQTALHPPPILAVGKGSRSSGDRTLWAPGSQSVLHKLAIGEHGVTWAR